MISALNPVLSLDLSCALWIAQPRRVLFAVLLRGHQHFRGAHESYFLSYLGTNLGFLEVSEEAGWPEWHFRPRPAALWSHSLFLFYACIATAARCATRETGKLFCSSNQVPTDVQCLKSYCIRGIDPLLVTDKVLSSLSFFIRTELFDVHHSHCQ